MSDTTSKPYTLKLTFAGGTGSVTGANFLVEGEGIKFLVDCGLNQGTKMADDKNWDPFIYDPTTIDYLFITHAHIDHIGRIPKLFHDGFKGTIYSTIPTKDITELMLEDTANILGHSDNPLLKEIYSPAILERCFRAGKSSTITKTLLWDLLFSGIGIRDMSSAQGCSSLSITTKR